MDSKTKQNIEELRMIEAHLQNFLAQKQMTEAELNEINNAIKELKKTKSESYKIVGNIMIKSSPENLTKELEEKKKVINTKADAIEKQEKILIQKAETLKKEVATPDKK